MHPFFQLHKKLLVVSSAALFTFGATYALFFSALSSDGETRYVYVDRDDTPDSLYAEVDAMAGAVPSVGFRLASRLLGCASRLVPGRYEVPAGSGALALARRLRGHRRAAVSLVVPSVRTSADLAGRLSRQLMADSATLAQAFTNDALLRSVGVARQTLGCLVIPNTYEVAWEISPERLLHRLKREHDAFWTPSRQAQARAEGLTPDEVATLASIVEQESANEAERPAIAGMYLNRLKKGMKLQADPTVKYALGDFALRRILHAHLTVDSPYNTYRYAGLPPGPICIPSTNSLKSVLSPTHHTYLYMCAKEDFSGTHNFATTYEEHQANAKRYAAALNERGIQ